LEVLGSIVRKLPQHEFNVRRLYARDENFRAICTDYEEAAKALRRWQQVGDGDRRAAEYAQMMEELLTEILSRLEAPTAAADAPSRGSVSAK
jgi:hypothetical protein